MVIVGALSSSVMVPVPVAVAMVALVGLDRVAVTVSFGSSVVSLTIDTSNVAVVAPAEMVSSVEATAV